MLSIASELKRRFHVNYEACEDAGGFSVVFTSRRKDNTFSQYFLSWGGWYARNRGFSFRMSGQGVAVLSGTRDY